jgi:hypothetical protein
MCFTYLISYVMFATAMFAASAFDYEFTFEVHSGREDCFYQKLSVNSKVEVAFQVM